MIEVIPELVKQFKEIQNHQDGFSVSLFKDNIFIWNITFFGPQNSPYEGGKFPALMTFPEDFPLHPPAVRFLCPMYHPNISDPYCDVCLPIFRLPNELAPGMEGFGDEIDGCWNPEIGIDYVIVSIINMFSDPNLDFAENIDAAKTWETDKRDFLRKVRRIMFESDN